MGRTIGASAAYGTLLLFFFAGASPARAETAEEFFPGKRVWASHNGMLIPTCKIVAVNPDGSYKVEVYSHNSNADPRGTTPDEALLRGNAIATIDVPAGEIERWNKVKYTTWVVRNGSTWPKAELLEDTGDRVRVRVFAPDGMTVEEERVIDDPAELEKFREINRATAPAVGEVSATSTDAERKAIEDINRKIEALNFRLTNGEPYPKVHTVEEVVSALRAIAEKYSPDIKAEANPYKRAELQDRMMREIYVTFETMTQIKHGGRDTTTSEWKAAGRHFADMLPGSSGSLQRDIILRNNACYGKSKIVWQFLNLADVPKLTGVGARLLDGGFHGILYVEYDDRSRRTWETTEGFEPNGNRAFKRWEVQFSGRGSGGEGLDYMKTLRPMEGRAAERLRADILHRTTAVDRTAATSRGITDRLRDRLRDRTRDRTRPARPGR